MKTPQVPALEGMTPLGIKPNPTPGPWHLGIKQAGVIVYDKTGWAVANAVVYHGEHDKEECKANARLIAAAPDLLAACERLLKLQAMREAGTMPKLSDWTNAHHDAAEAIKHAKGE